jgi:hypothetical protein
MSTIVVSVITAGAAAASGVAAVVAVMAGHRRELARAHEDRLWKERAATYVDLLVWANEVNVWALDHRDAVQPRSLPAVLHARVLAFATRRVDDLILDVERQLDLTRPDADPHDPGLHVTVEALQDEIRQELQHRRSRSTRERRRLGVGSRSLRTLGPGGPRSRHHTPGERLARPARSFDSEK